MWGYLISMLLCLFSRTISIRQRIVPSCHTSTDMCSNWWDHFCLGWWVIIGLEGGVGGLWSSGSSSEGEYLNQSRATIKQFSYCGGQTEECDSAGDTEGLSGRPRGAGGGLQYTGPEELDRVGPEGLEDGWKCREKSCLLLRPQPAAPQGQNVPGVKNIFWFSVTW